MFHTFETAQYTSPDQQDANANSNSKRRTSTVRACEPCRRRKIRCNGEHPCETCQWYRKAASCHYTEPRQRQMPSRRSVEKISATLQEYRAILQKLFPNVHPDQLKDLSKDRLVDLISRTSPLHPPSPHTPSVDEKPQPSNPDASTLEQLQQLPDEDDHQEISHSLKGVTDEVNMLSLSVKHSSSYLGISSVMAVLRVITWLDPECLSKSAERGIGVTCEATSPPELPKFDKDTMHTDAVSNSAWDEIPLINAYFTYVHPFIPLVEEQTFRDTYMHSQRTDSRWLLLLNAVLAMGCIAAGTSEDIQHKTYFNRAKQHMDLDTLDSVHLETVQALAILSGFYLHYIQVPNQANALMGAALRIATTLGLHRDYTEGVGPAKAHKQAYPIELRRRIWWCMFMLDAWVGNTLGRPSMGRHTRAVTAKPPQEPIGQSDAMLTLVQENVQFSLISTKMEDVLSVSPLMEELERYSLDAAYLEWYKHSSVQDSSPRPNFNESPGLTVLKNVMRWRYLSNRIILHRPILLWYAMRKITFEKLPAEKRSAIELCREVCADLINDIATTWTAQKPCQMSGWNACWLLYQAAMVPLLSLYCDPLDSEIVAASRHQVEIAMGTLRDLQPWSSTAKRSLEVIARLYEASKRHSPDHSEPAELCVSSSIDTPTSTTNSAPPPSVSNFPRPTYIDINYANAFGNPQVLNTANQEILMDNMFDTIKWSTSWDSPIGGPPAVNGWDYNSMQQWAGVPHQDEYFEAAFPEEMNRAAYEMEMPRQVSATSVPADLSIFGHLEHRRSC